MASSVIEWDVLGRSEAYNELDNAEKLGALNGWADLKYSSFDSSLSDQDLAEFDLGVDLLRRGFLNPNFKPPENDEEVKSLIASRMEIDKFRIKRTRERDRQFNGILSGKATFDEEKGWTQGARTFALDEAEKSWMDSQEFDPLRGVNWVARRIHDEPHATGDSLETLEVNYAAAAFGKEHFEALIDGTDLTDAEKFRVKRKFRTYRTYAEMDFHDYVTSKESSRRPYGTRDIFAADHEDDMDMDMNSFKMFLTKDRQKALKEGELEFDEERVTDEILQLWAAKRGLGSYADYITNNPEESDLVRKNLFNMFSNVALNEPGTWGDGEATRKEADGTEVINPNWRTLSKEKILSNLEAAGADVPEEVLAGFLRHADAYQEADAQQAFSWAEDLEKNNWSPQAREMFLYKKSQEGKDLTYKELLEGYLKHTKDPENFWSHVGPPTTLDNIGAMFQTMDSEDGGWLGDFSYGVGSFMRGLQAGAIQETGMLGLQTVGAVKSAFGGDSDLIEGVSLMKEGVHRIDSVHGKMPRWGRMFGQEIALLGLTAGVARGGSTIRNRIAARKLSNPKYQQEIAKRLDEMAADLTTGNVAMTNPVGKYRSFTDKLAGKTYFGLQASRSGTAMYMEAFTTIKGELVAAGMDPKEAEKIARTNAILPGIGGGLITYALMKFIPGDVMGGLFNKTTHKLSTANVRKHLNLDRKAWKKLRANKEISDDIFDLVHGFNFTALTKTRMFKGGARETVEEFFDEIGQGILAMNTYNPDLTWGETVSHATEAAFVGLVLGGGAGHLSSRKQVDQAQLTPEITKQLRALEVKVNELKSGGNFETAAAAEEVGRRTMNDAPRVPIESESDPDDSPVELGGEEGAYIPEPGWYVSSGGIRKRGLRINLEGETYVIPRVEDYEVAGQAPNYPPELANATTVQDVVDLLGDVHTPVPPQQYSGFKSDEVPGQMDQETADRVAMGIVDEVSEAMGSGKDAKELEDFLLKLRSRADLELGGNNVALASFYNQAIKKVSDEFKGIFVGIERIKLQDHIADYNVDVAPMEKGDAVREGLKFKSRGWLQTFLNKSFKESYDPLQPGDKSGAAMFVPGVADGTEVADVYSVALDLAFAGQEVLSGLHEKNLEKTKKLRNMVETFHKEFKDRFISWSDPGLAPAEKVKKANALAATIKKLYDATSRELGSKDLSEVGTERDTLWDSIRGNTTSPSYVRLGTYLEREMSFPTLALPTNIQMDYTIPEGGASQAFPNSASRHGGEPLNKMPPLHRVYRTRVEDGYDNKYEEGGEDIYIPNHRDKLQKMEVLWEKMTEGDVAPPSVDEFALAVRAEKYFADLTDEQLPKALDAFWISREVAVGIPILHQPTETLVFGEAPTQNVEIAVDKFATEVDKRGAQFKDAAYKIFWNRVAGDSPGEFSIEQFTSALLKHDQGLQQRLNLTEFETQIALVAQILDAYKNGVTEAIEGLVGTLREELQTAGRAQLKTYTPEVLDQHSAVVMGLLNYSAKPGRAEKQDDVVSLYHLDKSIRKAQFVGLVENVVTKPDWKETPASKEKEDATGAEILPGKAYQTADGSMEVRQRQPKKWTLGIWDGKQFVTKVEDTSNKTLIFSSAIKAKAFAAEIWSKTEGAPVRHFKLADERGEFKDDVYIGRDNSGWSESPWVEVAKREGYETRLSYGVDELRFNQRTKLSELKNDRFGTLKGLIDTFLGRKDINESQRHDAELDLLAWKQHRVARATKERPFMPSRRVDLKGDADPARGRVVAHSVLKNLAAGLTQGKPFYESLISKDNKDPVAALKDEITYTYFTNRRIDSTSNIVDEEGDAIETTSQSSNPPYTKDSPRRKATIGFAVNLVKGVIEEQHLIKAFVNPHIHEVGGVDQMLGGYGGDSSQFAGTMLGAYEIIFGAHLISGKQFNTHVIPSQLPKMVEEFKRPAAILESLQQTILKSTVTPETTFVEGKIRNALPPAIVSTVINYYAERAKNTPDVVALRTLAQKLAKQVGSGISVLKDATTAPIAIDLLHERLGLMARRADASLGEALIEKDTQDSKNRGQQREIKALPVKSYNIRTDKSGESSSQDLHPPYVKRIVDAVKAIAQAANKKITELSSGEKATQAKLVSGKVTWERSGTGYISVSPYFNERRQSLVSSLSNTLAEVAEGETYGFKINYKGSENIPPGTQVGKRHLNSLVQSISREPEKAISNYVKSTAAAAKPLIDMLKDIQGQFLALNQAAGGSVQLHKDLGDKKDGRWRLYVAKSGKKELQPYGTESFGRLEPSAEGKADLKKVITAYNEFLIKAARDTVSAKGVAKDAWPGLREALKKVKTQKKGEKELKVPKKEMVSFVQSLYGTAKSTYQSFHGTDNQVGLLAKADAGVDGAKSRSGDIAVKRFKELSDPERIGHNADVRANIEARVRKDILSRLDLLDITKVGVKGVPSKEAAKARHLTSPTTEDENAWLATKRALTSDFLNLLTNLEGMNPSQKAITAKDNINALAGYSKTPAGKAPPKSPTPPLSPFEEEDVAYFTSTRTTTIQDHERALELRRQQVPLTVSDAHVTASEGKVLPHGTDTLKLKILGLNDNREQKFLGIVPEGSVIRTPSNISGLRQGLPQRAAFKKLKPKNGTPFLEFLDIANSEEGQYYAVDSYFHVEKDGELVFTNHPFHMASYFSTATAGDSKGVKKYPQRFPVPAKYKEKEGNKLHPADYPTKLHPGLILDKTGKFIIGAATSFPLGAQTSHPDGRAVTASYVMAHTSVDKFGNSQYGTTLQDLHDKFTPIEKRATGQGSARGIDNRTAELNTLITEELGKHLLEGSFQLTDHEIAFLLPGLKKQDFDSGKKPSVKEVIEGDYQYPNIAGKTLHELLKATSAEIQKLKHGEGGSMVLADKVLEEAYAAKEYDISNVEKQFMSRFLLSMLKTRLVVGNPNIGNLGPFREARSALDIMGIIAAAPLDASKWTYTKGDPRKSPSVLPDHAISKILLGVLNNRSAQQGKDAREYLLGDNNKVRLLGTAKNLKGYGDARNEVPGGEYPTATVLIHSIADDLSLKKKETPLDKLTNKQEREVAETNTNTNTNTSPDTLNRELGELGDSDSLVSLLFGPQSPFDGLTEKTRAELSLRVLEEIRVLGVVDGEPDSLRVALLNIKKGASTGVYPPHYGALADILLQSGKLDFDGFTLELTDRIGSAGRYIPGVGGAPGKIIINTSATNPRGVHDLVIHELLHAAFDKVLSDPSTTNHQLVVDALDALIDRGRAFYEMGQVNRMGAQKRAEFQAQREADNYSLEIIKDLIEGSESALKMELPGDPKPSDYREVYRDIRTEELKANKYYDDVIQLRHAFGINEDGSFVDDEIARREFFAHLLTDPTTQWYLKEIDRLSSRGSSWDKAVRMVTRGISEDELDYSDGLVSAFLTLTGNENYQDLGSTKTLREIIGHTDTDIERVANYRKEAPAFSATFSPGPQLDFSSAVNKSLAQLGKDSPANAIAAGLGVSLRVDESISFPTLSGKKGEVLIPANNYREKSLVSAMVSASYEQAFTTGHRSTALKGFLAMAPLQDRIDAVGSWENLMGLLVADAYYGDVESESESELQTLRAEVLMRNLGLVSATHVETMLEVLGRITPEKKSFLKENYRSENSQSQWSSGAYVGDKINAERAIEEHGLPVTAEDYLSAKTAAEGLGITLNDYADIYIQDQSAQEAIKAIEGYILIRLEDYNKNDDPDEEAAVELTKLNQGLPHDASVDDVLEPEEITEVAESAPSTAEDLKAFNEHMATDMAKSMRVEFFKRWKQGKITKYTQPKAIEAAKKDPNVKIGDDGTILELRDPATGEMMRWVGGKVVTVREAEETFKTWSDASDAADEARRRIESDFNKGDRLLRGQLTKELSDLLLGKRTPFDFFNVHGSLKFPGEVGRVSAHRKISKEGVDYIVGEIAMGSLDMLEDIPKAPKSSLPTLESAPTRDKITELVGVFEPKFSAIQSERERLLEKSDLELEPTPSESKKSEAYEGDEEAGTVALTTEDGSLVNTRVPDSTDDELADEIKRGGKRSLKPKFLAKIWPAIKKFRPFSAEMDPTMNLMQESPGLAQKQLMGVVSAGHSWKADRLLRFLTVPGKGGTVLHEHAKEMRGEINRWVTKAQLFTSAVNNQLRKQYGVTSIGSLAETWDNVELSKRWGLSENKTAGAHLVELINKTQGYSNDADLVDKAFPFSNVAGMTQREVILDTQKRELQKLRAKRHRINKAHESKLAGGRLNPGDLTVATEHRKTELAKITTDEEAARRISSAKILDLYRRAAESFKADQQTALKEIKRLDEAYLASQDRAGEKLTTANSLYANLLQQRAANSSLQQELLTSGLLEQQMTEHGVDLPGNSLLENLVIKIQESTDIYLTSTYQLNDEKRNYMQWLSSKDPEAKRRMSIAYKYYKDKRIQEKAEKLAKELGRPVSEARNLIKMQSDPVPHETIVSDIRDFVQTFGAKGVESATLGLMNAKVLIPPKDMPQELREVAGAYPDNIFNAARTMTTLGTTVANQKFLTSMKETIESIQDEANKDLKPGEPKVVLLSSNPADKHNHNLKSFKASEGANLSGNFGPLHELYGPPLLVDALHELGRKNHGGIQRALMRISSFTMANVTTRRPRTHFRNFVGNPMFLVNAGMPLHAIKSFLKAFSTKGLGGESPVMKAAVMGARDHLASLDLKKKGSKVGRFFAAFPGLVVASAGNPDAALEPEMIELLEEYALRLVTGQDVRSNVIRETRKGVLHSGGGDPVFGISMIPNSKTRMAQRIWEGYDKVAEGMYGAEDDYWKAAAYEMQMTKLARAFGITDIDAEEGYAPVALRKSIKAMTPEQAQRILDTFPPRTAAEKEARKEALKGDLAQVAANTLELEAAYRVQKTMPNYSMTVALVKWMKRNQATAFIAPFISFYAETFRIAVDTPKLAIEEIKLGRKTGNAELTKMGYNRLAWNTFTMTASTSTMSLFFSLIGSLMMGLFDDDEDLVAKAMEIEGDSIDDAKAVKRFLNEWYQKSTLAFFGLNKKGNPVVMDVSHMFPLAAVVDPGTRVVNALLGKREVAEGSVPQWVPFMGGASIDSRTPIIGGASQEFLSDLFGRYLQPQMWAQALLGERYKPSDSLSEFETKIGDPLGQIAGEGFEIAVPGFMTDIVKLGMSVKDSGKIKRGRVVSPIKEGLSAVFGIKMIEVDVKEKYERTIGRREKQLSDEWRKVDRLIRGSDTVSAKDVKEAMDIYNKAGEEIITRAIRDYRAAKRYRPDANALLHREGGKRFRAQVRGNFYLPRTATSTSLYEATQKSREAGDDRLEGIKGMDMTPVPLNESDIRGPLEPGPVDTAFQPLKSMFK